jgi:hypothetical protein
VDAGEGQQLVEVAEPADVADLGHERRGDRGADTRDRPQPTGGLTVEECGDPGIGSLDLGLISG